MSRITARRVLVGPAVCQGCRQAVWLVEAWGWSDAPLAGHKHQCPVEVESSAAMARRS